MCLACSQVGRCHGFSQLFLSRSLATFEKIQILAVLFIELVLPTCDTYEFMKLLLQFDFMPN
jgi:hypothetical protein